MSNRVGELGESFVTEYIRSKGYRVLERNYHSRYGEIDIIADNDEYIVFIEVKTRRIGSQVSGVESVNSTKQRKIVLTAMSYLQHIPNNKGLRFDVVEVDVGSREDMRVKSHVENAFTVGEDYNTFF